jgi:hypothetical protein
MIEIAYSEFIRNTVKYTNLVFKHGQRLVITKEGRSIILMEDYDFGILKSALEIATTIAEK